MRKSGGREGGWVTWRGTGTKLVTCRLGPGWHLSGVPQRTSPESWELNTLRAKVRHVDHAHTLYHGCPHPGVT